MRTNRREREIARRIGTEPRNTRQVAPEPEEDRNTGGGKRDELQHPETRRCLREPSGERARFASKDPRGLAQITNLERVKGIEPSSEAWEAPALPLSYTRAAPIIRDRGPPD